MTSQKTFESAYERLEEILEKINAEQIPLDDALALYEEADGLIRDCEKRLNEAEQKIEILIKNREGSLKVDEKGEIQKENFSPTKGAIL